MQSTNLLQNALKASFFMAVLAAVGITGWAGCSKSSTSTPTPAPAVCNRACTIGTLKGSWSSTSSSSSLPELVLANGSIFTFSEGTTDSTMNHYDLNNTKNTIVVGEGTFKMPKQANIDPRYPFIEATGNLTSSTTFGVTYYFYPKNSDSPISNPCTFKKN